MSVAHRWTDLTVLKRLNNKNIFCICSKFLWSCRLGVLQPKTGKTVTRLVCNSTFIWNRKHSDPTWITVRSKCFCTAFIHWNYFGNYFYYEALCKSKCANICAKDTTNAPFLSVHVLGHRTVTITDMHWVFVHILMCVFAAINKGFHMLFCKWFSVSLF